MSRPCREEAGSYCKTIKLMPGPVEALAVLRRDTMRTRPGAVLDRSDPSVQNLTEELQAQDSCTLVMLWIYAVAGAYFLAPANCRMCERFRHQPLDSVRWEQSTALIPTSSSPCSGFESEDFLEKMAAALGGTE